MGLIASSIGLKSRNQQDGASIDKNGKAALLKIPYHNDEIQTDMEIQITMRDKGGDWKVIEVKNLKEMLAQIESVKDAQLKEANQPILEEIEKAITVLELRKKSVGEKSWQQKVHLTMGVRNDHLRNIAEIIGEIVIKDRNGDVIKSIVVSSDSLLKIGSADVLNWEIDVNRFKSEDVKLYELSDSEVEMNFKATNITLEDGSEIKLFTDWNEMKSYQL